MFSVRRLAGIAVIGGLAALGVTAAPKPAEAWWCCGVRFGVYVPPIVVAPPVYVAPRPYYYAPPPVAYYAPPPVAYAPPPPHRYWVAPHWEGGYWVQGHWS